MADYPGAVAAIRARLAEQWVDGGGAARSLIVEAGKRPEPPFPPIDPATGNEAPFLAIEIAGSRSDTLTYGTPGNRFFVYDGLILLHALTPMNEGSARAQQLACDAGEIFRAATFYQQPSGGYIRTIAPNPPGPGSSSPLEGVEAGPFYRVTVSVPFQYFHRA